MATQPNLERILSRDLLYNPRDHGGDIITELGFFDAMRQAHELLPAYWTPKRDRFLRDFWKQSDHLSGAVYALQTRIVSVPYRILPRNPHIQLHREVAKLLTYNLNTYSQNGEGWGRAYSAFVEDVFTQDNGGFMRIKGEGDPWEPIRGMPEGVDQLDSSLCMRTDNALWPVVYYDPVSGDRIPFYWTRIISLSLQSSPIKELNGVGYCAISRAIQTAQRLIDMSRYFQEKLGSRPLRAILLAKGINKERLAKTLAAVQMQNDNEGRSYFSKLVAITSMDTNLAMELINLTELGDGFEEESVVRLAMYTIALAFGVDSREIWTAVEEGATKGDAYITHIKARGKSIGYILKYVQEQMELKFVPSYMSFEFDNQDDALDEIQSGIRDTMAKAIAADIKAGVYDDRTARQIYLRKNWITEADFDTLELKDGRLPDGAPVLSLFFDRDADIKRYLRLGISDPMDLETNNREEVLKKIGRQERIILEEMVNTSIIEKKNKCERALAALRALRVYYQSAPTPTQPPDEKLMLEAPLGLREQEDRDMQQQLPQESGNNFRKNGVE